MAVTVAHSTTVTGADEAGKEINKSQWNGIGAHTVVVEDNTLVAAKLSASAEDVLFGRSTAGAGAGEEIACTAAGRALLDDAAASNQRTTLGLGTIATQNADSVSLTGGSISGVTGNVYTVQIWSPAHNPVDGQTVYFGSGAPATTTADIFSIPVPVTGTIIAIYLEAGVGGTLGTTESVSAYVRHNNTTDLTIATNLTLDAARQQKNSGALTQAVTAGDRIQLKIVHPTFVTNPTNVIYNAVVVIRP